MLEDGNVAPGQAFKPKQKKFNELGEEISGDSSVEEDVEPEEITPEESKEQMLGGTTRSFIQILFDSQITRQFEEE